MKNSIEKDIELLQNATNSLGLFLKCKGSEKYKTAIEHILSYYKRVLKENEELKYKVEGQECVIETQAHNEEVHERIFNRLEKENEELKNQEATARKINELLVQRYSNSISLQKVKDKIEELKAQYKTALEENSTEAFILKCQITILKELIEEREEK